jgi:uncharacterized protein (DUF427 family)
MAESVWDYPRPPRVEPTTRKVIVKHQGIVIAETSAAMRVLETSHPPVFYLPPADVRIELLERVDHQTFCEFKGTARYVDLVVGEIRVARAGWLYPNTTHGYRAIAGYYAFYPGRLDECTVDGEKVRAQNSDFYGGWITDDIVGPFKD